MHKPGKEQKQMGMMCNLWNTILDTEATVQPYYSQYSNPSKWWENGRMHAQHPSCKPKKLMGIPPPHKLLPWPPTTSKGQRCCSHSQQASHHLQVQHTNWCTIWHNSNQPTLVAKMTGGTPQQKQQAVLIDRTL